MSNTLLVQSSPRGDASVTRGLAFDLATRLGGTLTTRDLAEGVPLLDGPWIAANFTKPNDRTPAQSDVLALSDTLVAELRAADTLVFGLPIWNFGVPAALKAWIDLVARAGETFRYTEAGPQGLLSGKRAFIVVASGGVPADSAVDFATPYLRHALGFIGIEDVTVIDASGSAQKGDGARAQAAAQIDALLANPVA